MELKAIRDEKLYQPRFSTFEEYCTARWEMGKREVDELLEAVECADKLTKADGMRRTKTGTIVPDLPRDPGDTLLSFPIKRLAKARPGSSDTRMTRPAT